MNFMRLKWIQKTSASFLLSLFLLIHAVKTFHTHDSYTSNTSTKAASIVKAGFFCAICDFQIAKDSDATHSIINITSPVSVISVCYNHQVTQLHTFSITSSVRGPPNISYPFL